MHKVDGAIERTRVDAGGQAVRRAIGERQRRLVVGDAIEVGDGAEQLGHRNLVVGAHSLDHRRRQEVAAVIACAAQTFAAGTTRTFSVSWTAPTATGTYVLMARATDNGGNVSTSAALSVNVSGGTAPSVAMSSSEGAKRRGVRGCEGPKSYVADRGP